MARPLLAVFALLLAAAGVAAQDHGIAVSPAAQAAAVPDTEETPPAPPGSPAEPAGAGPAPELPTVALQQNFGLLDSADSVTPPPDNIVEPEAVILMEPKTGDVEPGLLLAEEPTGNLDTATGREIEALLDELHGQGTTVVLVTHNETLVRGAERLVTLRDGSVEREEHP